MRLPKFRGTASLVSVVKDSDEGVAVVDQGASALAASGSLQFDLDVTGYARLDLLGKIGNATTPATAAADCNVFVIPFLSDGVTLAGTGIGLLTQATQLSANVASRVNQYDIGGFTKVRVAIQNQNVAALQAARLDYALQR